MTITSPALSSVRTGLRIEAALLPGPFKRRTRSSVGRSLLRTDELRSRGDRRRTVDDVVHLAHLMMFSHGIRRRARELATIHDADRRR